MQHTSFGRIIVFAVAVSLFAGYTPLVAKPQKKRAPAQSRKKATPKRASCSKCQAKAAPARKRTTKTRSAKARRSSNADSQCHPRGYLHPRVAGKLNSAMRELRRGGIKPVITSAWRSSAKQAALHNCAKSKRCRLSRGVYGANPPGSSLHEAGFAVDIAGIATGPRGARRLTPRGRRIVQVMRKHGFSWRYRLADPAHFEVNPTRYGFRSVKQAIHTSQTRCSVTVASKSRPASKSRTSSRRSVSKNRTTSKSARSKNMASKTNKRRTSPRG